MKLLIIIYYMEKRFTIKKSVCYLAVLFTAFGCSPGKTQIQGPEFNLANNTESSVPVKTIKVQRTDLPVIVSARGTIQPGKDYSILAPFSSKVKAVYKSKGERVEENELILELDTAPVEKELTRVREDLLISQKRLLEKIQGIKLDNKKNEEINTYKQILRNLEKSYQNKEIDFDSFYSGYLDAGMKILYLGGNIKDSYEIETGVKANLRLLSQYTDLLNKAEIRSPISGLILFQDLRVGQFFNENEEIFRVLSFKTSVARVNLLERDTRKIKPGQKADLFIGLEDPTAVSGIVNYVSPVKDKATNQYFAEIGFEQGSKELLKDGLVYAEIIVDILPDVLAVPADAVLREGERYYVFVIEDDSAYWRWIIPGTRSRDYLEIPWKDYVPREGVERIEGISPGEAVAVEGHTLLTQHANVFVISSDER